MKIIEELFNMLGYVKEEHLNAACIQVNQFEIAFNRMASERERLMESNIKLIKEIANLKKSTVKRKR